jgi:hypothetical protein
MNATVALIYLETSSLGTVGASLIPVLTWWIFHLLRTFIQ